MLRDFIQTHRERIIASCGAAVATGPHGPPSGAAITDGVPVFLDQLVQRLGAGEKPSPHDREQSAIRHARELRERGLTIAQVVHDYGGICQAITQLAADENASITPAEFRTLNLALDDAIADAVTEYSRLHEHEGTERLGRVSHEMRNLLQRAVLAFGVLETGTVAVGGATAGVLRRSLAALATLVQREITEVRLDAGLQHDATFRVQDLLEDTEVLATLEARDRGLKFAITSSLDSDVALRADREIVDSVLGNLLQNAFKFTKKGGRVSLDVHADDGQVLFDVHDQCGGLPPGGADPLFRPFEQHGDDKSGLGLGLAIARRGAATSHGRLTVVDHPGEGCVFTLALPRLPA